MEKIKEKLFNFLIIALFVVGLLAIYRIEQNTAMVRFYISNLCFATPHCIL